MDTKTYAASVGRTLSDKFFTDVVRPPMVLMTLTNFEFIAQSIDSFKKALFYGKPTKTVEHSGPLQSSAYDKDELHFLIGLVTEVGELSEALRTQWALPEDQRDNKKIGDEAGDLLWYLVNLLNKRNLAIDDVMEANIAKLKARFPDKFSEGAAIDRNESNEKAAIEAHL